MTRTLFAGSPMLLGFDEVETLFERLAKSAGDGYPPYNVERVAGDGGAAKIRIMLALAGFSRDQIEITHDGQQLIIRGRQSEDDKARTFLHRGIAMRQFHRSFILADGTSVAGATLDGGILTIELDRPAPPPPRRIAVT